MEDSSIAGAVIWFPFNEMRPGITVMSCSPSVAPGACSDILVISR